MRLFSLNSAKYFAKKNKQNILDLVYPIGRGFIDFTNTDYSNYLGFKWERELVGLTPIGIDSNQTEFNTIGKTGGEKTHTLSANEIPAHTHSVNITSGGQSANHTHGVNITSSANSANHTHTYAKAKTPTGGPSNNTSGSTVLTIDQIPVHKHQVPVGWSTTGQYADELHIFSDSTGLYSDAQFVDSRPAGGGKGHTHTLSSHTHTVSTANATSGTQSANHTHTVSGNTGTVSANHTHAVSGNTGSIGGSKTHNNLQPYKVVAYWKRVK